MKSLYLLSALGILSLSSCGLPSSNAGAAGSGVKDGYFFSGSARTSGPMHWQKREKLRFDRAAPTANDPILSQLTEEDLANLKAMRKNN